MVLKLFELSYSSVYCKTLENISLPSASIWRLTVKEDEKY